jgi:hypothetical protein
VRRQRPSAVVEARESVPTSPACEVKSTAALQPRTSSDAIHSHLGTDEAHDATAPARARSRRYRYWAGMPLFGRTRLPRVETLKDVPFSEVIIDSIPIHYNSKSEVQR